jgi:hypothetical protein
MKTSSNTFLEVGAGVGYVDTVGIVDVEGRMDGGKVVGIDDTDGNALG